MPSSISYAERSGPTRVRAAQRAARLLLQVARRDGGCSATEAAAALDLAVPTAYHLLKTLEDEGLLARDGRRGFVLGPRVAVLAEAHLRDATVPDYLAQPLRALAAETEETAYLTAWRGGEIHVLESVEGANAVRVAGAERGRYLHPHARASGKLLLAYARPEQRAAELGREPLARVTPNTIVEPDALERELEAIRERGWAEDREEFAEGVACVAAPALVDDVVVAAFTVSAPVERYRRRPEALCAAVRRAARAAVGGRPQPEEDT